MDQDHLRSSAERAGEAPRDLTRILRAGLSVEEVAAALGISELSVHREWAFARARLL